ncbi:MAG TPA: hypothetical protein VMV94_02050 [Phycisphaerae bacterium]|nr:hypothetical protein [Phycisphaerae bacterium]
MAPELAEAIGEAVGVTAHDLKLRLRGRLPKSLVCCSSIEEAEAKAAALNELGVLTIVYEQSDLPPAEPVRAISLGRTKTGFRVSDRSASIVISKEEISLLVFGRRMSTRETWELTSPIWYSPSQVVGTGIPMALSGSMHVSKYETGGQHFLMLFRAAPQLPMIEISRRDLTSNAWARTAAERGWRAWSW